jgi:predicted hydrocarbon binding protein
MSEQDFQSGEREKELEEQASIIKLSMHTLKDHYGLNPGKYRKPVRSIGFQLGLELARILPTEAIRDVDSVVKQLSSYWMKYGIGEMFWVDRGEEMLLGIQFCSDCIGRGAGYTTCPFKEGILEAVLESKLENKYRVDEVECCGSPAPNCVFKIEPTLD